MADEAEPLETLENADELGGIRVDVVGEDVLVHRPPGRGVHRDEVGRPDPHRQVAQELPPLGAALGVRDFGSLDFSNRAVLLRRYAKKLRSVGLTFASAYKDEVEAQIMPLLEEIGGTDCIALITDPAADAMRQRRMYYGPLVGEIGTIWRNAAAWQWQATLQSLI